MTVKTLNTEQINPGRRRFIKSTGAGAAILGVGGLISNAAVEAAQIADSPRAGLSTRYGQDILGARLRADSVSADASRLPPPVTRDHAIHHDIEIEAREVEAKLDSGTTFTFMTWEGQVPGPMIRVRQGDTVALTVKNAKENSQFHNLDMHAIYGTGGGSAATLVMPGQSKTERFKCMYPGAFIYHCAVPTLDEHISRGMFGMIVVEPHEGMHKVDREFYLGQHEIYTKEPFGTSGKLHFNYEALVKEQPQYVVFNGAVNGFTPGRYGPLKAKVGETIRVFMVCGGPNQSSSFHPIGNVWSRCWPQGALANAPLKYVQTQPVAPGSCMVGDMELPVPETIKLVDHALTRVTHKGLLAMIEVQGKENPEIYKANA
ncbi:MAG: copper-containing nitrite reductase [Gammaproteobacteria bacterium]